MLTGPAAVIEAFGAGDTVTFAGTMLAGTTVDLGAAGGTVTFDAGYDATLAASVTLDISTPNAGLTVLAAEETVVNQGLIDETDHSAQIGYPRPPPTGGTVTRAGGLARCHPEFPPIRSCSTTRGVLLPKAARGLH